MVDKWKIDVSSQIKGHIENGEVILTFNGKPVTRINLEEKAVPISDGFEIESGRILKVTQFDELNVYEEYARDCDMGWC